MVEYERGQKAHLADHLMDHFLKIKSHHPYGIPVKELWEIAPRTDGGSVFEEGKIFGGITQRGHIESCVTPVPAPHVAPRLPRGSFLQMATNALGPQSGLPPKYQDTACFSPQLCVWARHERYPEGSFDFLAIAQLSEKERGDCCDAISHDVTRSVKMLGQMSTQESTRPVVWGTWGHGVKEERTLDGTTRGGPTLERAHVQVSNFGQQSESIILDNLLDARSRVNHFAPWVGYMLEAFGEDFAQVIGAHFQTGTAGGAQVSIIDEVIHGENGSVSIKKGHRVQYNTPVHLKDVFGSLIKFASYMEGIYQKVKTLHQQYYTSASDDKDQAIASMTSYFANLGLADSIAQQLTDFVIRIRPTYGQVNRWIDGTSGHPDVQAELLSTKGRYERLREKISNSLSAGQSAIKSMVFDMVKEPSDPSIELTWPVHSSFCYLIDDYEIDDGELVIRSLQLFPNFVTTEAAPEKIQGVVLKRPTKAT